MGPSAVQGELLVFACCSRSVILIDSCAPADNPAGTACTHGCLFAGHFWGTIPSAGRAVSLCRWACWGRSVILVLLQKTQQAQHALTAVCLQITSEESTSSQRLP